MKKWIIGIFAVVFIIVIVIPVVKLTIFNYNSLWAYSADYEEYADDFNSVKDYIIETYPNATDKWVGVSWKDEKGWVLFEPDTISYITLPPDVSASLEVICDYGFPNKDAHFDVIRIREDRIDFEISCGEYALVFSPDKKPTWLHSSSEDVEIKVKSIQDGWYHVTKDK